MDHIRKLRILLIEDQQATRIKLANQIANSLNDGTSVDVVAVDSHEGAAALAGEKFDLIFADLYLPDTPSPTSILRHCTQDFPGTPIIVVTSDESKAQEAFQYDGVWGFVPKRLLDKMDIRNRVREALAAASGRDQLPDTTAAA